MTRLIDFSVLLLLAIGVSGGASSSSTEGWIPLFDGKSLEGWRASENQQTFSVRDGMIVVDGARSHLFYVGTVEGHNFKNFEFQAEVLTKPGANSGIYFHTEYQEEGWPAVGYEVQVNNTHSDPRKTGGLYGVQDVFEAPAGDDEWFTVWFRVDGKRVVVKVDGKQLVDYVEPENPERPSGMAQRLLSSGTFALQGHDPDSVIYYRNIMVRPLPE